MNPWRLIPLTTHDAYTNMALDEALLHHRSQDKAPNTLRLYRWNPSAVSIGCFQSIQDEVNIPHCKANGIDVVRRITGGGAVYHDYAGEITYSLIVKEDDPLIPPDIPHSYRILCTGLLKALEDLGLHPTFKEVNDILVNGKKISGNAQTRRRGVVLQHGTLLVDLNIPKMFTILRVGAAKISDKDIKSVEDRVTSLKKELGATPDFNTVASSLKKGFQDALDIEIHEGEPTPEELQLTASLKKTKYTTRDWNYKR